MKYKFFYDESEHSRNLTLETIEASNFSFTFATAIVGFLENNSCIEKEYLAIDEKYKLL